MRNPEICKIQKSKLYTLNLICYTFGIQHFSGGGTAMLFSDVRVKDIDWIVHFAPQSPQFTSRNRKNHIIGIKLSGAAEHLFSDRSFIFSTRAKTIL